MFFGATLTFSFVCPVVFQQKPKKVGRSCRNLAALLCHYLCAFTVFCDLFATVTVLIF